MNKYYTTSDVQHGADALCEYWGQFTHIHEVNSFHREETKAVLSVTASSIAARTLRKAARDLNGSDPSIDLVVKWLLERAKKIEHPN